jgi:DNA polymerase beta catalytic subunit
LYDYLAVEDHGVLRKRLQSVCDMAKPRAPVIAPPRVEANIPMNVTLEAIAIVFDLVDPARPTRRPLGQRCQRGFDRSGNIRAFAPRDECAMASAGLFKSWYSMAPRNTGSVWKNHLSALANRGATAIHPKAGGITLLLATGSSAHVAGLREIAAKRNMSLDESGLRRGNKVIAAATEQKIYKALGMQPVAPELREGRDEIARALAGTLPKLVTDADIKGILHAHTDQSDGVDTLETMAEATLARGYQYFGIADHSQSAHYAGGLSAKKVAEQQAEAGR